MKNYADICHQELRYQYKLLNQGLGEIVCPRLREYHPQTARSYGGEIAQPKALNLPKLKTVEPIKESVLQ